jgi:hypothetical protein
MTGHSLLGMDGLRCFSRAARASGDGNVAQSGCSIATKPAASLAKVIGEDGLSSMYGDEVFPYKR